MCTQQVSDIVTVNSNNSNGNNTNNSTKNTNNSNSTGYYMNIRGRHKNLHDTLSAFII